nr:ribosomal protein L10, mitochondrial [Tanacetum cinerariifolium]
VNAVEVIAIVSREAEAKEALAESLNIPEGSQDKDSLKVLTELPQSTAALLRHRKGSWDEEKKEKVQGEMSSKELVKTRFFSTCHGVKLEAVSFMLCPASCPSVFIELSAPCALLRFIKEREPCLESEKKGQAIERIVPRAFARTTRKWNQSPNYAIRKKFSTEGKPVTSNQWRKLKNPWFLGRTLFRPSCFRTGKKKRFFAQLAHSAGPTCISYLAEEASDRLEFIPFWDSMDQDLLLLYRQYQSTLVDHMDVEKSSQFDELETSLFHFNLPSSYLCFVCSPEEIDLFNLGIHLNNYNYGQRVK